MDHHKHANDPELDPDYSTHADGPLRALWKSMQNRQPRAKGGFNAYGDMLMRIGRQDVLLDGILYQIVHYSILFALAWSGYAIEAALLWWLPRHIALTYIQFYLSWAPHNPGPKQGPLSRHAQLSLDPWKYRISWDAVPRHSPPASAYSALQNTARLLGNETHSGSPRLRRARTLRPTSCRGFPCWPRAQSAPAVVPFGAAPPRFRPASEQTPYARLGVGG